MTYNRRGLGSVSREENKYSFWQLYSCRSHKDNWKGSGAGQEIQLQRAVQLEKIGEFISYPEGKGVKTSVVLNYRGGKQGRETEPGHDSDIRIFSWDQYTANTALRWLTQNLLLRPRVIRWLWWHYIRYIDSTITINFFRTTSLPLFDLTCDTSTNSICSTPSVTFITFGFWHY